MKLSPLTQTILDHLQRHGDLSGVEAQALYRCRDLPKRVSEIKQAGVKVIRHMKTDPTGQRYARYELAPACVA